MTTRSIQHVLDEHGSTDHRELARMGGARYWGPGAFSAALHEALAEGGVRRLSRTTFAAADSGGSSSGSDDRVDKNEQRP